MLRLIGLRWPLRNRIEWQHFVEGDMCVHASGMMNYAFRQQSTAQKYINAHIPRTSPARCLRESAFASTGDIVGPCQTARGPGIRTPQTFVEEVHAAGQTEHFRSHPSRAFALRTDSFLFLPSNAAG